MNASGGMETSLRAASLSRGARASSRTSTPGTALPGGAKRTTSWPWSASQRARYHVNDSTPPEKGGAMGATWWPMSAILM